MRFPDDIGLYFITDHNLTRKTVIADVTSALNAGAKVIQYREKELSTKEMYQEVKEIRELTYKNNALLIINDRIDISLAVDADGVHIGQDDMPFEKARELLGEDKIIGLTVHNIEEALVGENIMADYLGISPIFATNTKRDAGKPTGLKLIEEIKGRINIPLVAIGGINLGNIRQVLETGIKNVAVISAIVASNDVEMECRKFIKEINQISGKY